MRLLTWPFLVTLLISSTAAAQQQPKGGAPAKGGAAPAKPGGVAELEGRVAKVEAELDEVRKGAVDGTQAAQTAADLSAQVTVLRQQVEALQKGAAGDESVRRAIDSLTAQLDELRQNVAALRASVHADQAPETHSVESGGLTGAYEDGFILVDGDRYSLRMKGFLQFRYTALANETLDDLKESSFTLRRARLSWDGKIHSPLIRYQAKVELGQGKVELLDYWLEVKAGPVFIKAGQFKVPFVRQFLNPAEELSFVERSIATEEFRYDRDIGVQAMWTGLSGRVEARAGIFNGAGKNVAHNDNLDPLLAARVVGTVLGDPWKPEEGDFDHVEHPGLQIGVEGTFENAPVPNDYVYVNPAVPQYTGTQPFNTDVDGDGDRDNVRVMQAGVELAFRWKGFGLEAEGFARKEDWGAIGAGQNPPFTPDDTYFGGYAQASYFILPQRFQVGVRGSWTEVSPLVLGGKSRSSTPESDTRRELSALLGYYRWRHGIELSGMYSFLDWGTEDGPTPKGVGEQRFIVELQGAF